MFTGLIEAIGQVQTVIDEGVGRRLTLHMPQAVEDAPLGASIAINGVCLTVVAVARESRDFQAGPETLQRTNLGQLRLGDPVNLERSLRFGDRLGGHLVQGHVDGVGTVDAIEPSDAGAGEWTTIWFRYPPALRGEIVSKGSIAVDGVSLTVVGLTDDRFSVALIPHTLTHTTLGTRRLGDTVNLETDILGKYVARQFRNYSFPSTAPS